MEYRKEGAKLLSSEFDVILETGGIVGKTFTKVGPLKEELGIKRTEKCRNMLNSPEACFCL